MDREKLRQKMYKQMDEISQCPNCHCMTKTINNYCGKCKKSKRVCDYCKKPMLNSWAGEWVGENFIEIHTKCKEKWKLSQSKQMEKSK